jgi:hypothetical protein
MPEVPDSYRKEIMRKMSEKSVKESVSEDSVTENKYDIKDLIGSSNCVDSTLDLACALSKMNLFEETMIEQEKQDEELEEAKSVYRKKVQEEIMNEKSLDIIKKLDF